MRFEANRNHRILSTNGYRSRSCSWGPPWMWSAFWPGNL